MACDYGHPYSDPPYEVRRLPVGEHASLFVCYTHYLKELRFRKEGGGAWHEPEDFPTWESLALSKGEEEPHA